MEIPQEIEALKERNKKVELEKAWEISWTRRLFITLITYLVACLWLYIIKEKGVFLKSVIPTAGYLLSTISLPFLKQIWMKHRSSNVVQ